MHSGMYYPIQIGAIEAMKNNLNWFNIINNEYSKRRKIIWSICDFFKMKYSKKNTH